MTPYSFPADRYRCLLDEQPYYLVPPRLIRPDDASTLIVNPLCQFSWHGFSPTQCLALQSGIQGGFLESNYIIWVSDAVTRAIWPYWIGPEFFGYMAELKPGRAISKALPAHVRWVLRMAEILVTSHENHSKRLNWLHSLKSHSGYFQSGYTVLGNIIPPFHVGSLRRYYRSLVREGVFRLGDKQVPQRCVAHNETVARYLHNQFTGMICEIARVRVKPSYAYAVAYQSGAQLQRHTDRRQCEYSVTICTDFTPEPTEQSPWPINLEVEKRTVRVWQYLGEGLLYRGRRLQHYRTKLPEGYSSTSLLLHYVDETFAGPLD